MSSGEIEGKIRTLAILSCIKTVSAISSYMQNGNRDKAMQLLESTIKDLSEIRKKIESLKSRVEEVLKKIESIEGSDSDIAEIIEPFREELKNAILSSPSTARICIKIQPHLEIMYSTLGNITRDLKSRNREIRDAAFKDSIAYLSYIRSYLSDLLKTLEKL